MNATCSIAECDNPLVAKSLCSMHYQRWRNTGSTEPRPRRLCSVDGCEREHKTNGFCDMHVQRWRKHGDPLVTTPGKHRPATGTAHPFWTGDAASYRAVHSRVRAKRGRAALHQCQCGAQASEWAYDHSDPDERLGDPGDGRQLPYSVDLDRYLPLCISCHRRLDKAQANLRRT